MSNEKHVEDSYSDQQACCQATTQVQTKRVLPSTQDGLDWDNCRAGE